MQRGEKVHLGEHRNWTKYVKGCNCYKGEYIHKSCKKKPNSGNNRLKNFLRKFHHNSPI